MKKIFINLSIIIFTFTSCSTDETIENTILPIEEIEVNSLLEKSFAMDDGYTSPETTYSYNSNNQITEIAFGATTDDFWSKIEVTYNGNVAATVTYTNPNNSIEYQVSDINNTISLTNTNHLIEIDYTGGYIDSYRKYVPNNNNLISREINFTRDINNNIITQVENNSSIMTTHNYSNHDNSPSVSAHRTFTNDDWLIFGLKSTENNPLTTETITHIGTSTIRNSTVIYDDQNNVITWTQGSLELMYEYE